MPSLRSVGISVGAACRGGPGPDRLPADAGVTATEVTIASVVVFFLAVVADAARVHGPSGAALLVTTAGGGGLVAEAIGVATGWPFGRYAYTGTLGAEVLGVPVVVPLAWVMMAWPALVVARTLAVRAPAVVAVGAAALTAWDVFLDPQMVAAGHWTWFDPFPGLPLVPGIPLTNYVGWLLVAAAVIAVLHRVLRAQRRAVRASSGSIPVGVLLVRAGPSGVLRPARLRGDGRAPHGRRRGTVRRRTRATA